MKKKLYYNGSQMPKGFYEVDESKSIDLLSLDDWSLSAKVIPVKGAKKWVSQNN